MWLSCSAGPDANGQGPGPEQLTRVQEEDKFVLVRQVPRRNSLRGARQAPRGNLAARSTNTESLTRQLMDLHRLMHPQAAFEVLRGAKDLLIAEPLHLGSLQALMPPGGWSHHVLQAHVVGFLICLGEQLAPLHARQIPHLNVTTRSVTCTFSGLFLSGFKARDLRSGDLPVTSRFWGIAAPEVAAHLPNSAAPAADVWQLAVCILHWLQLWPAEAWSDPTTGLNALRSNENAPCWTSGVRVSTAHRCPDTDFHTFWSIVNGFEPRLRDLLKQMLKQDPGLRPSVDTLLQQLRALQPRYGRVKLCWQQIRHHSAAHCTDAVHLLQTRCQTSKPMPMTVIAAGNVPLQAQQVWCRMRRCDMFMIHAGALGAAIALGVVVGIGIWSCPLFLPGEAGWLAASSIAAFTMPISYALLLALLDRLNFVTRPLSQDLAQTLA